MQPETISNGENRYLTVTQLAERLQISESTIYGWVDRDAIPFLMAGDLLRFDPSAINLTFHDLRHTFGTRLADAGVDIVKIAELMDHQSILTTRRYTHATDQGKRAAIAQLASYRRENCHKLATTEMRRASQPTASSVFA